MAIKKYRAKVTGVHAMTGISIEQGKEYDIEETLAGSEIFVASGDSPGREEIKEVQISDLQTSALPHLQTKKKKEDK